MRRKEIGKTGVLVPELAQGTWNFGGGGEPLRVGVELGASFIDTAEGYQNEAMVGEAIRGIRERVFLASKVSPRHFRFHDVIRAAECSLRRLQTDRLDLYQLHWPNYTVPLSETMAAMERLVDMGKVRFIGVSNFSTGQLRRAQSLLSKARIVSNQVRYNLLDRSPERDLLPYCEKNGVSLLAYSPLATNVGTLLEADPGDVLGDIGAAHCKTRAQIALNWGLSHPSVIAIFKAEKIDHVRENCEASGWSLTPEERRRLCEAVTPYRNRSYPERLAGRVLAYVRQRAGGDLGDPEPVDRVENSMG